MKKIQLDITPAVAKYASKYGAIYEQSIGWYCHEPIPAELQEFVLALSRPNKSKGDKYIQCPKCGGQMKLQPTRRGGVFWSCMLYPRCKGAFSVDEEMLVQQVKKDRSVESNSKDNLILNHNPALYELGLAELGSLKSFENWLIKSKKALGGQKPIEIMSTEEGCRKVMGLLRALNQ